MTPHRKAQIRMHIPTLETMGEIKLFIDGLRMQGELGDEDITRELTYQKLKIMKQGRT